MSVNKALLDYNNRIGEIQQELIPKIIMMKPTRSDQPTEVLNLLDRIREECDYMESLLHKYTNMNYGEKK